jgi:predicted small secreted protein
MTKLRLYRTLGFAALLAGLALTASACNTVDGVGRDISGTAQGTKRVIFGQ